MDNEMTQDAASLLRDASYVPEGMTLEENNPLESIPTMGIGREIQTGQVIAGWYEGTETITSAKFKKPQKRDANGVGQQDRHVIRLAKGDKKIAIWNTGGLGLFFSKRTPGEFVRIKYTGKGVNEQGNDQHFFEFEVGGKTQ